MPNVVQIELQVDSSGAVTGFRSLNAAGAQVTTTLKGMGAAGTQSGAQLEAELKANTAATQQLTAALNGMASTGQRAFRTVGSHALSELDSVRMFRDVFGIHIPRSMEKMMAQSKAVMATLNAMQGAMIAVGGVGVFLALGKQVFDFAEEIERADDDVKKFDRNLSEMAAKKFFDMGQFSQLTAQYSALGSEMARLDKQHANSPNLAERLNAFQDPHLGVTQALKTTFSPHWMSEEEEKRLETLHEIMSNKDLKAEQQLHTQKMADIEAQSKAASAMRAGEARDATERRAADARAVEEHRDRVTQSNLHAEISNRVGGFKPGQEKYIAPIDMNAPDAELSAALKANQADASAKNIEFSRQEHDEIVRLQNEATNSGLHSYQLMMAQKEQALDEFRRKYGANAQAEADISRRFDNEALQRMQEQSREIDRRQRESQNVDLTGLPLTAKRGRDRQTEIDQDLRQHRYFGTQDEQNTAAERDRQISTAQTDAEIVQEKKRFADTINDLVDASNAHQLQGFARITAEQKKQLDDLEKRYEEVYGKPGTLLYQGNLPELQRGQGAIGGGADAQRADLTRKNSEETRRMEEQSARAALPQQLQREQEIRDQYNDRVRAYQQMLADQEISQDDFNRRVLAAGRELQGQLAAEARQERDRLAAEIEPFFRHPLEALEKLGEQQAAKYLASAVQHARGGNAADMLPGKRGGDLLGGWGMPHTHTPHGAQAHDAAASAHDLATLTVTASTVIIHGGSVAAGASVSGLSLPGSRSGSVAAADAPMQGADTADGSTSVFSVPSITGGASPNFGFPNIAPGAPSGTFGVLPGAGITGIPGASGNATPSVAGRVQGGLNDARQAVGLGKNLAGMFSKGNNPYAAWGGSANGVFQGTGGGALGMDESSQQLGSDLFNLNAPAATTAIPGASSSASGMAGILGTAGTAFGGAAALFGAGESNGGAGGALQGAMGGMELGAMVGGPIGAAVGAAAGAIFGAIGLGGRAKAEQYYQRTVRPRIAADIMDFGMGSEDYQTAYNDLISLDKQARDDMKKFGVGGKSVWNDKVHPDITNAMNQLTREQKAGRSQYGMSAGEFHGGGLISGFGDYATSPEEGWVHAQRGETVMHQSATAMHGDALSLMLAGANRGQMASYYGAQAMAPSYRATMQQAAFGPAGHTYNTGDTFHISAIDTQSFNDALMANKHGVRAAQNASYAENSGGSDFNG